METPILFGLVAMFGWGAADYVQAYAIRKISTARVMMVRNLITLGFSTVFGVILFLKGDINFSVGNAVIVSVSSIIYAIGYTYYMKAVEVGKLAVIVPICSAYVIVTVLLSVAFAGERPTLQQSVGMALATLGVIVVSGDIRSFLHLSSSHGLKESVIALFMFGVAFFIVGFASQVMSGLEAFIYSSFTQAIIFLCIAFLLGARIQQMSALSVKMFVVFGVQCVLVNGAWLAYLSGTAIGEVSLVTSISSVFAGFTAVLAIVFNSERLLFAQYGGLVMILAGVFIISL